MEGGECCVRGKVAVWAEDGTGILLEGVMRQSQFNQASEGFGVLCITHMGVAAGATALKRASAQNCQKHSEEF